jgi:succinyl-CoA synthetase beta subunit
LQTKRTGYVVDLMEFQAKELFAKHGVVTTLGVIAETPRLHAQPPRRWAA